jgi:hypothetical protein
MQSIGFTAPRSDGYVDWSEAYSRVENYFFSLRIKDKLLLSQLVAKILLRTANKLHENPEASPSSLAVKEAHHEVQEWFNKVLSAAGMDQENIGTKGRLALFISNLPTRWQSEFLHEGPWPEPFLQDIRDSYLRTGPVFQKSVMEPRVIDLGPVSAIADDAWRVIARWPVLGTIVVWAIYIFTLGFIGYLTH